MSSADEQSPPIWNFEHSIECSVSRDLAWRFWTDVNNWPIVDPSVESATLDGPFAAGTKGITKPRDMPPIEWRIAEAEDGSSARMEIPAPGAILICLWKFEDSESGGARITQQARIEGPQSADYVNTIAPEMEKGIPQAMRRLVEEIIRVAGERA